jgi:putative transposase
LISASDRANAIKLIDEATLAGAREKMACKLEISQRTLQRWKSDATPLEDQRPVAKRPTPKNKLSEEEVQEVLKVVNQSEFQSLPPSQIVPTLADREIYIASESSFYRILRNHNMQYHRGRSKKPSSKPISTHCATSPNQV